MAGQGVLIEEDASEAVVKQRRLRTVEKPAGPPPSITAQAWLSLERERRELEAKLKTVVTEQEKVRVRLLDEWATEGINKEKVQGYTIHTQRKLYPKIADRARLAIALQERGLSELLTVDEKAFGIYVTACDENGVALPESIAAHLGESFERYAIVVRIPSGHGN